MSSMIKKKAAFGKTFKPKAPQLRKPPGAPLSATSSARPSIESHSQSQTPTPATLPDVRTSTQPDTHDIITGSQSQPVEVEPTPQPKSTISEAALSQTAAATENRKRRAEVEQPNASSEPTLQPPTKKTRIIPSTQDSGEQSQDVVQQTMAIQQSQSRNGQASTIKSAEAQSLGPQSPSFASLVPSSTPNTSTKQYRVDTLVTFPVLTGDAHQSDTPILDPTPQTSNSQSSSRETTQETRSEGEVDLSAVGPGQSNGRSQIIPSVPLVLDGTSGVANIDESNVEPESESQPQQGSALRRKKIRPQEGDARTPIDMQTHRPKRATGEKKSRKKKEGERKKRRRAETPEGAEDAPLPAGITMGDLCKDLRIGKKWSKADEIKRKDNERKIKAKLDRENDILNDTPLALAERAADAGESPANGNGAGVIASSGEGATNDDENAANRHQGGSAEGDGARGEGVQMTIINGNIVIDERSREWDAHKAANEGRVHEVVEENDFSKLITAGSHMKKVRAMQWTAADTELFYKCLKTYGTDFGMIAKVFPGRNRRQIKLKFNAEDRHFPAKITKVLTGTPEPIDVNEHQKQAGVQFEDLEAIEAAQKAEDDRHAEEEAERAEAAAELTRKKKAEIQSLAGRGAEQPEGTDGEASAAPKSKKKGAARNKAKNKHSIGGEEVEIVGTIDR